MKSKTNFIFLILFSVAVTLFFQYPAVFDYYTINDDVRVESFIYFKILDNTIYPDNPQVEWAFKRNPIGYHTIYYLGTLIFRDPIIFGKLLTFILAAIVALYSFKLGALHSKNIGWGLCILFSIQIWAFQSLSGGMSRSFAYPLILSFLYYFMKHQKKNMVIILLLQLLIYPISLLISLTLLGIHLLVTLVYNPPKKIFWSKERKSYLLFFLLFAALIFFMYTLPNDLLLVDKTTIASDPIYTYGGRINIYPPQNPISLISKYSLITFLISLVFIPFLFLKKLSKEDNIMLQFFITGFILYILAVIFIPKFYYPDRYLRYTLPLVFCYLIATQLHKVLSKFSLKRKNKIYYLIIITFSLCVLPTTQSSLITCDQQELYAFFEEKPVSALIAGHPQDMSCIPSFAKRNVFASHESIYPIYKEYHALMEMRLNELFLAYYAETEQPVLDFCNTFNVSYIVVNKDKFFIDNTFYQKENGGISERYYIEPFNYRISEYIGNRTHFFLLSDAKTTPIADGVSVFVCPTQK